MDCQRAQKKSRRRRVKVIIGKKKVKTMSKEDLKYLTDEELEALRKKNDELKEAIEAAKRNAYDEHAYGVVLIVFQELRALVERFIYARDFYKQISET